MATNLKAASWNIQFGRRLGKIEREIRRIKDFRNIDILGLQEASVHREIQDSRAVGGVLGRNYGSYQVDSIPIQGRIQSEGLIWNKDKIEMKSLEGVQLPLKSEVMLPVRERVLLRLKQARKRIAVVGTGEWEGGTLRVYVVHINLWGLNFKSAQFDFLINDILKREETDMTLVMGDFNTIKIQKNLFSAFISKKNREIGFTELTEEIAWTHSFGFKQKLDGIFIKTGKIYTGESWHVRAGGSDHIPIFSEIKL